MHQCNLNANYVQPMTGLESGVATCPQAFHSRRMTWRKLPLLAIGTLPILFFAATAMAASAEAVPRGLAVLYNEEPGNLVERHPGSVEWRTDRIAVAGRPDELVIHGEVGIPDVNLTMAIDIRRNTDPSLPASHLIVTKFKLPKDVAGGEVINNPGILMKFTETARGTPLDALSVKAGDGSFLVSLSNLETFRQHNLQLLRERAWIDIPMVYGNQHRAILAVEKGYYGEGIFNEAMTAWEHSQ